MRIAPLVVLALVGLAIIPAMPYGYYGIMRWAVCVAAIYMAIQSHRANPGGWTWVWIFIAGIYNPIVPVHASRGVWTIVNLGTIAAIAVFLTRSTSFPAKQSH